MGSLGVLWGLMGSLWGNLVPMGLYGVLWVLWGLYGVLCILWGPYGVLMESSPPCPEALIQRSP